MAKTSGPTRANKAKFAEMEDRIREMRRQEDAIKSKIYKLEASITAAPVFRAGERLRNHNLLVSEDEDEYPSRPLTRWQSQRVNRARSRQAMTALFLVMLFITFAFWFYQQLRANGVI
ncbi:MAG: hypothetical protein EOP86_06030 [Verrucomicrobiaceae bacterium]|nr:MAG: hypothetical protein EOP86_06030 [Verrucomicrobiaceae bacterium]